MALKNNTGISNLQDQYQNQKSSNDIESQTKEVSTSIQPKQTEEKPKQEKSNITQKRNVGRPATKDIKNTCKHINVAIPRTLLDQWEEIKLVHGNNLTAYITKLIKKDMETNYKQYKELTNSLKNI